MRYFINWFQLLGICFFDRVRFSNRGRNSMLGRTEPTGGGGGGGGDGSSAWLREDGGAWLMEDGSRWLMEN